MPTPSPRGRSPSPADPMRESVAQFEGRRRRWAAEAGRTLVAAAAVAGMGWLVVIPAVGGFALGHWLDARSGTGVVFSAGLGLVGLGIGCWSAWQRLSGQRRHDV